MDFAKIVAEDLRAAGFSDVEVDSHAFVFATLPENLPSSHPAKGKVPTIGFLAHLDTSPDAPGKNVKARIIEKYDGGIITYKANPNIKLSPEEIPDLKDCIGHTIITSDGTTLLGADDKAGIAVIVELGHYLKEHPEILHGRIRIGIMPDEENMLGTEKLDLKKFGPDFAYALDASGMGEIEVETFNGYESKVTIGGQSAFPGDGKGVFTSATQVAAKFIAAMQDDRWPQNCDGRQPIWWADRLEGQMESASFTCYLRSFDLEGIEESKQLLEKIKTNLLKEFPRAKIEISTKKTYRNYKEKLDEDPRVLTLAIDAMNRVGITPHKKSVRGGSDACRLCFMGLMSTNLFTGFHDFHNIQEWASADEMEASLKTVVELLKVWTEKSM